MTSILLVMAIILVCVSIYHIITEKRKKTLLTSSSKIPLEIVMAFSCEELAERLKRYYSKDGKKVLIEYADGKYLNINPRKSQTAILNQLVEVHSLMISKKYNADNEYAVTDYINKIMYDIWLNYADKSNYKTLFWRKMNKLYSREKISKSSYNEVYRRFYKYKFL